MKKNYLCTKTVSLSTFYCLQFFQCCWCFRDLWNKLEVLKPFAIDSAQYKLDIDSLMHSKLKYFLESVDMRHLFLRNQLFFVSQHVSYSTSASQTQEISSIYRVSDVFCSLFQVLTSKTVLKPLLTQRSKSLCKFESK